MVGRGCRPSRRRDGRTGTSRRASERLARGEGALAEREVISLRHGLPRLFGRSDDPWKIAAGGGQAASSRISGSKACTQCKDDRKPLFAGQPQLGPERRRLRLARDVAGEVQPRLADGLCVAETLPERRRVLPLRVPRMHALRAQLDAAARRAVGVDIDVFGHDGTNVGIFRETDSSPDAASSDFSARHPASARPSGAGKRAVPLFFASGGK